MKKDLEDDLEMQFYEETTGESAWKGSLTEVLLIVGGLALLLLLRLLIR